MSDSERRINWAHSVLNDPGSTDEQKRRAYALLAKHDPEGLADHDDDPIRTRGQFEE